MDKVEFVPKTKVFREKSTTKFIPHIKNPKSATALDKRDTEININESYRKLR